MNEQINSAAELDALPVGSVVARLHNDGHGNSVYTLTDEGWRAATEPMRPGVGPVFDQDDERMADLTVLYRPDQPQPDPGEVDALRAEVARAVSEPHSPVGGGWQAAYPGGLLESRCVCGVTLTMTRAEYADGRGGPIWADHVRDSRADAVMALLAQQPTVAEVKAEALPVVDTKVLDGLRAAETRLRFIQHHWPADTCAEVLVMLERLNADRLEAEALSEADRIEREARS